MYESQIWVIKCPQSLKIPPFRGRSIPSIWKSLGKTLGVTSPSWFWNTTTLQGPQLLWGDWPAVSWPSCRLTYCTCIPPFSPSKVLTLETACSHVNTQYSQLGLKWVLLHHVAFKLYKTWFTAAPSPSIVASCLVIPILGTSPRFCTWPQCCQTYLQWIFPWVPLPSPCRWRRGDTSWKL